MKGNVTRRSRGSTGAATLAVEGSGLGLSIVREIARVHDAQVAPGDAVGGSLVVSVRFPAVRSA
ncbi:signal transduction histidine kinase [Paraburkholderia sp. GAS334]|jgi:two-component system sensor histidine kinase TctE